MFSYIQAERGRLLPESRSVEAVSYKIIQQALFVLLTEIFASFVKH